MIFERHNSGNWGTAVSGQNYRTGTTILNASNRMASFFGISIAISGNYAIVGAHKARINGQINAGAA